MKTLSVKLHVGQRQLYIFFTSTEKRPAYSEDNGVTMQKKSQIQQQIWWQLHKNQLYGDSGCKCLQDFTNTLPTASPSPSDKW